MKKYLYPTTLRYRLLTWLPLVYATYALVVWLACIISDACEKPAPADSPWWLPWSLFIFAYSIIGSPLPGLLTTIAAYLLPGRQPQNRADVLAGVLSFASFITCGIVLLGWCI